MIYVGGGASRTGRHSWDDEPNKSQGIPGIYVKNLKTGIVNLIKKMDYCNKLSIISINK